MLQSKWNKSTNTQTNFNFAETSLKYIWVHLDHPAEALTNHKFLLLVKNRFLSLAVLQSVLSRNLSTFYSSEKEENSSPRMLESKKI